MRSVVLDAWAVLAFLQREGQAAVSVRRLLRRAARGNARLVMNVVNVGGKPDPSWRRTTSPVSMIDDAAVEVAFADNDVVEETKARDLAELASPVGDLDVVFGRLGEPLTSPGASGAGRSNTGE